MNETQIKELRAHAGKLVADGEPLRGVFEYYGGVGSSWFWLSFDRDNQVPNFADGDEWRIAKPKKQLIDWSHPYFKGCATNYGKLLKQGELIQICDGTKSYGNPVTKSDLRLATPANDHANWQPFFSTPENDAKLRELAKMVKVEVRYTDSNGNYKVGDLVIGSHYKEVCNYRITGECQDGWTDNKGDV